MMVGSDKVQKMGQLQSHSRPADSGFGAASNNATSATVGGPCLLEKELVSGLD